MSSFVGRFVTGTMYRIYQQTTSSSSLFAGGRVHPASYYYRTQLQPSVFALFGGWARMLPQPPNLTNMIIREKHTMKTHKGIAKRFKVRGKGSLRRTCARRQHNTGWKPRRRINKLGLGSTVKVKKIDRALKICLGILGKQKR